MATKNSLTEEQIEQFTDVMVGKLASVRYLVHGTETPDKLVRDEIRVVIVDTMLLVDGALPLERWLEGERAR
jgi:hypothetical protein